VLRVATHRARAARGQVGCELGRHPGQPPLAQVQPPFAGGGGVGAGGGLCVGECRTPGDQRVAAACRVHRRPGRDLVGVRVPESGGRGIGLGDGGTRRGELGRQLLTTAGELVQGRLGRRKVDPQPGGQVLLGPGGGEPGDQPVQPARLMPPGVRRLGQVVPGGRPRGLRGRRQNPVPDERRHRRVGGAPGGLGNRFGVAGVLDGGRHGAGAAGSVQLVSGRVHRSLGPVQRRGPIAQRPGAPDQFGPRPGIGQLGRPGGDQPGRVVRRGRRHARPGVQIRARRVQPAGVHGGRLPDPGDLAQPRRQLVQRRFSGIDGPAGLHAPGPEPRLHPTEPGRAEQLLEQTLPLVGLRAQEPGEVALRQQDDLGELLGSHPDQPLHDPGDLLVPGHRLPAGTVDPVQ